LPTIWVGEGLILIMPMVDNGLVRFPLGFVDGVNGDVITDGGVVKVPILGEAWVLDGEFALSC
ncbi:MAG: hypothetical protein ACYT04_54940, partial [Nostoc sp.]